MNNLLRNVYVIVRKKVLNGEPTTLLVIANSILWGKQKRLQKRNMKDLTGKNERLKCTVGQQTNQERILRGNILSELNDLLNSLLQRQEGFEESFSHSRETVNGQKERKLIQIFLCLLICSPSLFWEDFRWAYLHLQRCSSLPSCYRRRQKATQSWLSKHTGKS